MWQRIQTLYLAISTILIGIMFFSNKAAIYGADGNEVKVYTYIEYIPYLVLMIIVSLLNILALTTYKIRVFQMRTAVLSAIITLALQIWLAVDFFCTKDLMVFKLTAIFPFISVVLNILAARGIFADQLLVESAYHLRAARRKRNK